jgi:hypothetical protein
VELVPDDGEGPAEALTCFSDRQESLVSSKRRVVRIMQCQYQERILSAHYSVSWATTETADGPPFRVGMGVLMALGRCSIRKGCKRLESHHL